VYTGASNDSSGVISHAQNNPFAKGLVTSVPPNAKTPEFDEITEGCWSGSHAVGKTLGAGIAEVDGLGVLAQEQYCNQATKTKTRKRISIILLLKHRFLHKCGL
jgi:hypothetical protein